MGYREDLEEFERLHPNIEGRLKGLHEPALLIPKPDKLSGYRDQRLERPDGQGSLEPEYV